jgi:hypothetical protein
MYIYVDYEIIGEGLNLVPQYRAGIRYAEIQGKPDIPKIICDVLDTHTKIVVCGKLSTPSIFY